MTLPPPSVLGAAGAEAGLGAATAAELLGLAARIYAANTVDVPALADRVIACAFALGGNLVSDNCCTLSIGCGD